MYQLLESRSPELQLLIDCCLQKEVSVPSDLDKALFIDLVKQHRVVHQVYARLSTLKPYTDELLPTLEKVKQRATKRMLALSTTLIQIQTAFAKSGIDVLSFKGPTLSVLAYGDVNSRFSRDLDLLVSENQIDSVQQILLQLGFYRVYPDFPLSPRQQRYFVSSYDQMVFVRKKPHTVVELHWRLFQNKNLFDVAFKELCERKTEVSVGNCTNYTLPPEELVIYVAAHGAKHKWEKLYWLLDFYRLCKGLNVDWQAVLNTAEKQDLKAVVLQAIVLCRTVFEQEFLSSIKLDEQQCSRVQILVSEGLSGITDRSAAYGWLSSTVRSLRYRMKLKSGLRYRLGYFHGISVNDFKLIGLPDLLFPLYFLLRPFSWMWRIISRSNEN